MIPFAGLLLPTFRHKAHATVVADVELSIFGLPNSGTLKIRRISIMRKADGEMWVAWPRDKYQKNGQDQYYNIVTDSGGAAPYSMNAWIIEQFNEWAKNVPAPTSHPTAAKVANHEPVNPDAEDLFR